MDQLNETELKQPEGDSTSESIEETSGESQESFQNPEAETQAPETEHATASPDTQLVDQSELDDMGVPWKNRYMESQKKLDRLSEQLNAVAEKIDSNQGQKREKYSIEELEAFAEREDIPPEHKRWAKGEIRKLEQEQLASIVESKLTEKERMLQARQMEAEAFQTVVSRYPDAFKRNAQGQVVGWNENSPMTQRVAHYMQDPEIKGNPRALLVASALAFSDVSQNITAKATKQTAQAKAEVKNLQKKTLTEGGGVSSPPPPKSPMNINQDRFNQTGKVKDGAAVFKEILTKRGRIQEG